MEMRPFGRLLPVAEARRRLLAAARPISRTERVPLDEGLGRVAAEEVRAPRPVPAFARATWDGYTVSSKHTRRASRRKPVEFHLVGEVFAEERFGRPLQKNETVAIATGGALPRGADAVVLFEEVRVKGAVVRISSAVARGDHVAQRGEDFSLGSRLVLRGEVMTPASLGALASIGRRSVRVYRRPVVSVIPNGNELLVPGDRPIPGKIFESNNFTLGAVVSAMGGVAIRLAPVPDDPRRIESAIRKAAATSDLVLVTGGSSVGERDYLPAIFPKIGRLLFHGIAVRPGKPTLAARTRSALVVGLPGHPTSCLSNGYWLLLPLLRKLARLPGPGWRNGSLRLGTRHVAPTPGLSTVVPLRVRDGWGYSTFHDSSAITSLSDVGAFALLPPSAKTLRKGTKLPVHFLPPPIAASASP